MEGNGITEMILEAEFGKLESIETALASYAYVLGYR